MRPLLLAFGLMAVVSPASAAPAPSPPTCLASNGVTEPTAAQRRRHREVWSDSLWLVNRMRARYPERLAAAYVDTWTPHPAGARLVFRVTGDARIPPMRLGDRAKDVPVVVEYGAPHSLKAVEAIRIRVQDRVRALVPTLQGEGYSDIDGAIELDVYAADAAAERRALAQCAPLSAVYGMPVRIRPLKSMVSLH